MRLVEVADVADIPTGTHKRVLAGGEKILLANVDGAFYALSDRCTHMGGSLSGGRMQDGRIVCPSHGAAFDIRTGRNVGSARILFLKTKPADVRSFRVELKGTRVFVEVE